MFFINFLFFFMVSEQLLQLYEHFLISWTVLADKRLFFNVGFRGKLILQ